MNKIKKYLKTFKWKNGNFTDKGRVIGFNLFSLCFSFLILYLFSHLYEGRVFINFFLSIGCGYFMTFLLDITGGIGREGPIFK